MNIVVGIYALYWEVEDLIYIGLSQDIKSRYSKHMSLLDKGRHSNYKVQEAYNKYGPPSLYIIEVCKVHELSAREIFWCKEFNALGTQGLCIVYPGAGGRGELHSRAKFTKLQILRVFSLLYKGKYSVKDIEEKTKVTKSTIRDISNSKTHIWLKDLYPLQYNKMLSINRRSLATVYKPLRALVRSPDNRVIEVYSISEFCRQEFHDVTCSSNMGSVIRGNVKSFRGYTLCNIMK